MSDRRHYRTDLNNLCIQAGWALRFDDNFTGPQNNGTWTSTAYVNDVSCGQGSARDVRTAREEASYHALVYFGRA
ncbi:uncharacterized protein BT62DRAFT_1070862 [Guyanagaster necrorhizus]|uniref:DRBM domain-containing protein n=1 Tax=Guyanagaster necrorhizus TaxID=856835 RepID=A0A9P7W669_9AGAR|nr:uncharacterized protein BT62DRAFT_1070862 [Guyanagaster necrorhizus MCA 3950]KAG7453205.1 hypothetical protein BT62DRAFT_1070862 [Guyanagaster necrorhizus MCA 3950]